MLDHIAFRVDSRTEVDAFHAAALEAGGTTSSRSATPRLSDEFGNMPRSMDPTTDPEVTTWASTCTSS